MSDILKSGATLWGALIVFFAFGGYAFLFFAVIVVAAIISAKWELRDRTKYPFTKKRLVSRSKLKSHFKSTNQE